MLEPAHLDLHCRRRSFSNDRPNHIDYRIIVKLGAGGMGVTCATAPRTQNWAAPLPREVSSPSKWRTIAPRWSGFPVRLVPPVANISIDTSCTKAVSTLTPMNRRVFDSLV